jgi:8-oxo-dGTP diphosphatase
MIKTYAIGTSVYATRNGQILILKRAMGAAKGAWSLPGGALDEGETIEECARRELLEETGLVPTGPLSLFSVTPMFVYDHDMFIIGYTCKCEEGDVHLSQEHSGYRWIDAQEYRNRYFSEKSIEKVKKLSEESEILAKSVQAELDEYLSYCKKQDC